MKVDDRLQQLLGFLAQDPNDDFTLYALAMEYQNLGQKEESRAYFERLHQANPLYVGMYYHFGKLLTDLEEPENAEEIYREGIAVAKRKNDRHAAAELREALASLLGVDSDDLEL
jgi:tetratricopeptide (TPR) repeat protein